MSNQAAVPRSTEPTRRQLNERQSRVLQGLLDSGMDEVRAHGYDGLTVRNVARRAGVAAATAYTYFTSKDHLVAEVFWRVLASTPTPPAASPSPSAAQRVRVALSEVGLLVANEPELAAACTTALLASDPDVRLLRDRIGLDLHRRMADALGSDVEPRVVAALDLACSGALLQAGMGHLRYADFADRLAEIAALLTGEAPESAEDAA